ncbi:Flp pilus assembly protein CpaB [Kiloniella antarctica]|uniref:Flp pilus assembly protein CpaB n=1 Tax=Kiloniella antarctica TaxID=1550907 RepID=A0ABW5BR15_9PROT
MAKRIILILIALMLSGGTAYVANNWLKANKRTVQSGQTIAVKPQAELQILTAKKDIPIGKFVNENDFAWQSWPENFVSDHHLTKEKFKIEELNGRVSRTGIPAGEPINIKKLVSPGERGFLAAVLKPGHRALSVNISSETSVSGLVYPGDRVDMISSMTIKNDEDSKDKRRVSETILTNVRVLALGTSLETESGKTNAGAKTVTVELTPSQVEIVSVSAIWGKISLALRPLAKDEEELQILIETGDIAEDGSPSKGDSYTWDYEATEALVKSASPAGNTLVISRGNSSVIIGGN